MRRARRRADSRRPEQIQRSVGDLSAFRPYLGEGGERSRRRDWRIASVFIVLSLALTFLPASYREGVARGVRRTLLRPVLALQQGAVERQVLFEDPAQLRAERDSLAAFLVGNASVTAENRLLRDLLGLRQRLPPSFVPAEVVRIPGRGSEGYFQLTAGAQQGVAAGAPIVAGQGLVGRVRETDGPISFGIDWMHPDFRASAMTVEGDVYGILEPRRVGGEPLLVLTGTPRHVELDTGVLIVTSGHGGVFPRGIPIGTVVGQEGGEEGWQRNYLVRPLVSPAEMAYVLVLGAPQRTLEGQDLALVWGIRPVEAPVAAPGAAPSPPAGGGAGAPAAGASAAPGPRSPSAAPSREPLGVPAQRAPSPPSAPPAPAPAPAPAPTPEPEPGPPLLGEPVRP